MFFGRDVGDDVDPVPYRPSGALRAEHAVPERRVRLLHWLENDGRIAKLVVLAFEGDAARAERLHHDLIGFQVDGLRLLRVDAEARDLERRDAAAHAELDPPSAQMVERAD